MATVDPQINDLMTTAQIRQIRQKLAEENMLRAGHHSHTPRDYEGDYNRQRQNAYYQRQELLDRLRLERKLRDELTDRPASYSALRTERQRRRTPEIVPPRAASEPPTDRKGNSTPRHILEHQVRPIRLEPLDQPAPAVTQYVQPTPILVNPVQQGQQPNHLPPVGNTKAEMMEMMMLQNAQMHQVIMNQMMMSNLPKNDSRSNSRAVDVDDLVRRRPPSVHHHHYEQPPPRQLPPLQVPHYGYPVYQSPRYYPAEMEPLQPPRDQPSYLHQQYLREHPSAAGYRP